MKRQETFFRRNGPALLTGVFVFALTYAVVLRLCSFGSSDYLLHTLWAVGMSPERIVQSFYDGSERLWHVFVKLLFSINGNMWGSAAGVTAAANAAAYCLLWGIIARFLPENRSRWSAAALLILFSAVNALFIPGQGFYISCGAINTWHNPTNLMVRPFALAVFYMTVNIYDRRRAGGDFRFEGGFLRQFRQPVYTRAELLLYPLCLLFSTYAKPSFLQFFAPAIFLFLLVDVIRTRGMLLPFCIKLALAYLPAALILFSQFTSFFVSDSSAVSAVSSDAGETAAASGIAVYFLQESFASLREFMAAIGKTLLRIVRLSAFPLFILALSPRAFFSNTACRLGLYGAAVGRLESVLLHETGSRATHGNMLWAQYLSVWILWGAVLPRFLALVHEKTTAGKLARLIGIPLLLWHFFSGMMYLLEIFRFGDFYI